MNINEQLEKILANLGVEMEYAEHEQHDENSVPDVSIFSLHAIIMGSFTD
ncbi:MAG TPA: hypothetical protein VFZ02_03150 [Ktedonobacteraceae bacterium]